jgi:hypothetical protein
MISDLGYFLSVRKGPKHKSRCPHASVKDLRLVDYGDISGETLAGSRLVEFHNEAIPVSLKAQAVIEAVGGLPLEIARQSQLVAASFPAAVHGELHHLLTDPLAPPISVHHHIFYDTRRRSHVREVIHDQQCKCADNRFTRLGNVDSVVGIVPHPREEQPGLFDRDDTSVVFDFSV